MCLHYNCNRGHNQLFVSAIRDNNFRGFVVIMSNLQHFVERLSELLIDHEMKPANLAKELGSLSRLNDGAADVRLLSLFH